MKATVENPICFQSMYAYTCGYIRHIFYKVYAIYYGFMYIGFIFERQIFQNWTLIFIQQ